MSARAFFFCLKNTRPELVNPDSETIISLKVNDASKKGFRYDDGFNTAKMNYCVLHFCVLQL